MIDGSDREFWETSLKKVDRSSNGWSLTDDEGWSIFVTNEKCSIVPTVGESLRYYGQGIGRKVRGLVIGGRVYRYQTASESAAEDAEASAKYERESKERDAAFRASVKPSLPGIQLRDPDGWAKCVERNSVDAYSYACAKYAADWASLMERDLGNGETLAEIAEETSREADTDGITGFMYGAAVSMLAEFWEHGELLRRWHNLKTQIGTEGESANESGATLNPALLSIAGPIVPLEPEGE